MISASTEFNAQINKDSRTFRARIKKGEKVISGEIKKVTICKGACGDNFSVGSIYVPSIEVEISGCSDTLENDEILLQIGILLDDGTEEYINIGYYTVTKPRNTAYQTTFTAVGRISAKLNVLSDIPKEQTISNLAAAITEKTGVPVIFRGLIATGSIEKDLKGLTCKELLEVITSVLGGFATEDNKGNIVISKYSTENPISYNGDRVIELPQFNDYDYTLSGIKVVVSEEGEDEDGNVIPEVAFTDGTPRMVLSNPYMTEALFTNFAANTVGYSYRPGTVPIALGDPRLEPWDCLEVTDVKGNTYTVPCLNIVHTFDGGLSTTITAPGDSEAEEESATKGPIMQQLERMSADILTAKEAIVKRIKADEAELLYAKIETVEAEKGRIDNLSGELSAYKQYVGEKFTGVEGNFTKISGDLSTYKEYVGEKFTGIEGDFKTLNAEAVKTSELEAKVGQFGYVKTKDLESEIGKFGYLTAAAADLKYANIGDFNAISGRVGSLEGNFADFVSGDFGDLSAGVADIKTLLFGSATGTTITTDFANTVVSHIGTAQIDSGMIKDLSFDKITGFDVNTTNVTVHSNDGKSQWKDNTIQISDANRVRVQIGKDTSGDYSMYVWDKTGKLMFDALGLTGSGIQREIIRNDMVAQNAAIDGSKLNIESVFREMNGSTYTLESNHLTYDGKKLDLFLGTMSDTVTDQGNLLSSQGTQITAIQGKLDSKIWQQDINTAKGEMNTKYSNLAQDLSGFKTTVGSTYATKTGLNEAIAGIEIGGRNLATKSNYGRYQASKWHSNVSNVTIDGYVFTVTGNPSDLIGFKAPVTPGTITISGQSSLSVLTVYYTMYNATPAIVQAQKNIRVNLENGYFDFQLDVPTGVTEIQIGLGYYPYQNSYTLSHVKIEKGNKATDWSPAPEDTEAEITAVNSTVSELEVNVEGISGKVTNTENDLKNLTSRVETAEQKITPNAIISTVSSTYATKAENKDALDKAKAAQTTATQTADKFNWIVKSGTSATDFTLTDRVAQLTAQQINLNGLVSFSGLDSAAQGKINTANTNASTAKTTANNAASTATTAKNTAESAASTASTAKTTAETAKNTANTASTNASNALSTANAAKLATEVETISGNLKKFKNVCGYTSDSSDKKGALIITTPITPSRMVSVHIKGYNYVDGQETIDLTVGFYNYSNGMVRTGYINNGSLKLTPIKVAKVSSSDTRAVIIIGDATTTWQYPKIIVDEVITGFSTVAPDSYKDGFSATITTLIPTTYAQVTTLSGTDVKTLLNSVKSVSDDNGKLLASWCAANDKTLINGGKIFAGSIGAKQISVDSLEAICAKIGGFTIGSTYLANNATALGTLVSGKTEGTYVGIDGISTNQIVTDEYGTFNQEARLFNGTIELWNTDVDTGRVNDSSWLCGGTLGLFATGRTLYISAARTEMISSGGVAGGSTYVIDIPTLQVNGTVDIMGSLVLHSSLEAVTETVQIGTGASPTGHHILGSAKYIYNRNAADTDNLRTIGRSTNDNVLIGNYIGNCQVLVGSDDNFTVYAGSTSTVAFRSLVDSGKRYFQSTPIYTNTTSSGSNVRVNSNGTLYRYVSSSMRYKEKITTKLDDDLDPNRLYDLNVWQYKYRDGHIDESDQRYGMTHIGLLAEDVKQHYPIAANYNDDGEVEDWNERYLIPPMLKLIQNQKKEIDALKKEIDILKAS